MTVTGDPCQQVARGTKRPCSSPSTQPSKKPSIFRSVDEMAEPSVKTSRSAMVSAHHPSLPVFGSYYWNALPSPVPCVSPTAMYGSSLMTRREGSPTMSSPSLSPSPSTRGSPTPSLTPTTSMTLNNSSPLNLSTGGSPSQAQSMDPLHHRGYHPMSSVVQPVHQTDIGHSFIPRSMTPTHSLTHNLALSREHKQPSPGPFQPFSQKQPVSIMTIPNQLTMKELRFRMCLYS